MGRRWRTFQPDLPHVAGARVRLPPAESHHVRRVLRLSVGDTIALFDGRGNEWVGTLREVEGESVSVDLLRPLDTPVESPLELCVYQGLCRQDKMDQVVQKLTEVGVAAIHPLDCRHAERFPPDSKRLQRWTRIAIEACKQSGRRCVPRIEPVGALPDASGDTCWLLDPGADSPALADVLAGAAPGPCRIAVGPESGFIETELQRAAERGWRRVSLGPRILRTETAGLAAACVVLHAWGDLGR